MLGVNDDTIARVLRISSAVGREAVFFDAAADAAGGIENGHFDPEDGRIYINAQSKNPVAQIISHELTHSIEGGGSYGDLQRLVLRRIQQDGGDLQTLRQQKAELYARHGKALKASEVDAEIVAEYVEKRLLTDEQSIREMVRQDRTLGQRILQFINELLAKLGSGSAQERAFLTKARSYYRSALQETQSSFTAEMRQQAETQAAGMEGMEPRLERLRQQMANGEISDTEAEAVYDQTYDPEEDLRQGLGGLRYSIQNTKNIPYQKQIDAFYSGDSKTVGRSDDIYIADADNSLSALGIGEKPFFMLKSNLKKSTRIAGNNPSYSAHGISESVIRKLPELIKSPALIVQGDGRISIIPGIMVKTEKNNTAPLLIAVNPNSSVDGIDAYEIKSIYGRENFANWLDLRARDSKIIAGDEKKAAALLRDVGKQYPEPVAYAADLTAAILSQNEGGVKLPTPVNLRRYSDIAGQDVNRKSEGRKYSYAGQNAKNANLQTLREAQEMQKAGADMESIRRATGWHLGMEGKWRFEIDDSGMQLRSDAADLSNYTTLGELVDAPELFEAYPQLKDVRLAFADLEDGERGYFNSGDNTIVLSEELRGAPEDTLVHEIQHAIQDVEGFASGASPEYWARREYASGDLVTERLQREYDRTLNRLSRADQNQYIRYMELERELDRLFLSDENSEDGKRYAKLEAEQDALYEALYPNQWFRDLLDLSRRMTDAPGEYLQMYENTAGEIEARDAASRRRMTAEERRATMPKMADENTVFAEGTGWNRSFDYDPETASIKEQIEQSREELNKMEVVARETVPENLPNKDAAAKWAADRLKASGYKVDRQGFGEILFTKKDLDKGLRYADTPAEKAALAALPKVLKRGIEIGDHTNHKKREKQTVTFAAPVELNGVRGNMGVVINRNGNHYYAHRIVLPDGTVFQFSGINKDTTQELSRGVTVSGSLADTTSVASTDSVRGFDENVNTRYSLSEEEEGGDDVPAATLPMGRMDFGSEMRYNERTKEGGMSYEREMGDDNLRRWGDSQNTGERNRKSAGNGEVSAQRSEEARFGLYGGRSGETVFTDDNEGRRLTSGQARQLQGTAVTDETGAPLAVYHFTPEMEFETFERGDIGFHFGTREQATQRGKDLNAERGRLFRAYLNIKNPYHVRLDLNTWHPSHIGLYLWSEGVLSDAEWAEIRSLKGSGYDSAPAKRLREMLEDIGIDGFSYPNMVEGAGDSYIALRDDQIIRADILSEQLDSKDPDIRYSVSEEDTGDDVPEATLPTGQEESAKEESAKKQTEAEYQAERLGYPILNGVQVVPMRTYVHATDVIRDENNNIVYEKDGKPRRRDNYGMVVGRSPYDADELIVAFRNDEKHTRKDEVFISIDDLEVALPRGDSEEQRMAILMEQEPVQPDNENMSAEDRAELNEMLNRAQAKEMARRAPLEELEPVKREEVTGKARVKLEQAERALVRRVGRALSVPRFAQREYLQEIAQRISEEYLTTGRVSEKTATELFEQAYQKGIVVDEAFYQQYKDIKEHLRTQAVTISEEDKHDIADWGAFRKSAFGQLRIVNQGGTPVDIAYEELRSMAPALFPYDISHPADQLVRMLEVAQSIEKTEKSLSEYYGQDAEEFKRWAKNDFKEAVYDSLQELRTVKRYADERTAKASAAAEAAITPEQAAEAYKQLKKARWESEKAKAKNLLTDHDKLQLGRLLRGEIELRHLDPDTDNVKGIRAVYEATAEYERLVKLLTDYKKRQRAALLEAADRYLETANDWKDKRTGLAYARETMERNFEDIVPDRKLAKELVREYITPVHDAEASATRFKTEYRDKVRALELSRKVAQGNEVSEAHAVQLLGEAMDNIRILENSRGRMAERDGKTLEDWRGVVQDLRRGSPSLDWAKINSAIESFRKIYDELFRRLNDVRVRNGYEPINYRSGYFPHFQPGDGGDGILSQFGRAMGIDTQVTALPTSINGLTHNFKPGITWFGNAQQRLGFNTAYDAVEGFDKYIEGAASVIFQTENIQRLRALATQMRYRTGDEGLRKQVDAVRADPRLTEEEKQSKINEIHKEGRFVLSNFVNELDEYTNLLANKKSRFDRGIEAALGRRVYSFLKNWESRVGANMIAGNLSSALTNFIPLTQARGQIGRASMLKGMWDTLKAYRNDDGFASRSSFLTNRRGSDPIVKSWSQRASGILGKPMEYIDTFTADSIVRARYDQNLRRGLSEAEAMSEADAFAGKVMADRSKGSMPTLFESKNPIFKAFTQFQLEVNNQFSEVFKDLPRAYRDKGLAALAAALFKYFIGAFLFNEVYEYIVGRRPALDPIGLLNDTAGDLTGYALPNLVELGVGAAQGELPSFQTEKASLGETGKTLAKNALGELPFSSGLALLGADIDGGRIPAASAVPDLTALWDAATKEGWSGKRRWKEVQDELSKLAYILPPFGGNQAQKIWKSVKALIEGGSYTVDADGSRKLQYPVFTDDPWETALNAGRMMLFGKSSLPTAQDWVEDNFNTLGAKQTAAYQDMLEAGVRGEDAFVLLQELRGAEKTDEQSRNAVQREILRRSDVPGEGKAITYYALLASDRERELMDALDGADPGAVTEMLLDIKDAGTLKGAAASGAKREAIAKAPLTDEEKQTVYRYVMGTKQEDGSYTTSREDDIMAFEQVELDFDTFLKVQNEYTVVNEKYSGAGEKAMAFSHWVNSLDLTAEQAETVRDCFRYFSQIPAEAARYDSFVSAGLEDDAAYALADSLNALEPEEGKKTVSNVQRYRAVIEADLGEDEQMAALQELMQESEYSKLQVGYDHGILPEAYVRFRELLPQYDADGNGTLNQKEVEKALDSMGGGIGLVLPGGGGGDQPLTVKQQAVLWQLANKSWKPNKNPYSTSVGKKVYDALNAEPASGGILLSDGTGGLELPRG